MDVFFIEDDKLLELYKDICNKTSNSTKKELYCEPIYHKMFWKTKVR